MPQPIIDSFNPLFITFNNTLGYTSDLEIIGKNFDGTSIVHIGDFTPTIRLRTDTTKLTVVITTDISGSSGTYDVIVVNSFDPASVVQKINVRPAAAAVKSAPALEAAAGPKFKIGILSSIRYEGTPIQRWFELGLGLLPNGGGTPWTFHIQQEKGYSGAKLTKAVADLCADTTLDLIVTFGGNVTAEALAPIADGVPKDFLSAVGNLTPELANYERLRGGVNFDTVERNAERFNWLTQHLNIPPSEICFLSNERSAMRGHEEAQWNQLNPNGVFYRFNPLSANPNDPFSTDPNKIKNIQSGFDNVFQTFARNGAVSTMLISADPTFQHYKNQLISAANNVNKRVCYPLQAFRNKNGVQPIPGKHWLHGPKLAKAFFQLGRDAATVAYGAKDKLDFRTPPMLIDASDDES